MYFGGHVTVQINCNLARLKLAGRLHVASAVERGRMLCGDYPSQEFSQTLHDKKWVSFSCSRTGLQSYIAHRFLRPRESFWGVEMFLDRLVYNPRTPSNKF